MKKPFLSAIAVLAAMSSASAQTGYTFSVQPGQAYTTLINIGTNMSAGMVWDNDTFSAPIPFTFQLDGRPITRLRIGNEDGVSYFGRISADGDTVTGFLPMNADLRDRGATATPPVAKSPIRYTTTGSAPQRIFKVEFHNAGFAEDAANTDSANFQIWLYEGSNIVELRYGASRVTPAKYIDYFSLASGGPFVGLFKNVDLANGNYGKLFFLRGDAATATMDSVTLPTVPSLGIVGYPVAGTVYRFTPGSGSTSISEAIAAARAMKVYPTLTTDAITVEWSGAEGESYQILSATGGLVGIGRLQHGAQSIAVNGLPPGSYNLRVAGGGHVFVKR